MDGARFGGKLLENGIGFLGEGEIEILFDFSGVKADEGRVLAREIAREESSGQDREVFALQSFQVTGTDARLTGDLLQIDPFGQTRLTKLLADSGHSHMIVPQRYNARRVPPQEPPGQNPLPGSESLVTVVVVNWNRRELLRNCLTSLEAQTGMRGRFDVILVDNGSEDYSVEMAEREFGDAASFRLQVIENSRNLGYCEANNQGMAQARSQFLALLNNDAEAEPGWLAALCQGLVSRPEAGMAAS